YFAQAAIQESKILLRREPIAEVLEQPEISAQEQRKLKIVLAARDYAEAIGLKPGDSFTQYTRLEQDTLAWVVMGSRKDAFELYTWWFPFVGSVPYKGYFSQAGAEREARRLERLGYETWVRGTDAISTLGWFNDPLLSTTLQR